MFTVTQEVRTIISIFQVYKSLICSQAGDSSNEIYSARWKDREGGRETKSWLTLPHHTGTLSYSSFLARVGTCDGIPLSSSCLEDKREKWASQSLSQSWLWCDFCETLSDRCSCWPCQSNQPSLRPFWTVASERNWVWPPHCLRKFAASQQLDLRLF